MTVTGAGDAPAAGDAPLLPPALVAGLRSETGADQVTIYLSEPAAPFARGSYTILGHDGVAPEYQHLMRGPLPPASLARFSVTDREPTLLVDDVGKHEAFSHGRFARTHRVVSLVRLSVRTANFHRADAAARLVTLWEVFLSFRQRRTRAELKDVANRARRYLRNHNLEMRRHGPLLHLMNWRSQAARLRRLDGITRQANGGVDPMAPSTRRSNAAAQALDRIADLVLGCCDLSTRRSTVSFYHTYDWGDGEIGCRLLRRFPGPHAHHESFRLARERADATAAAVCRDGLSRVELLPTDGGGAKRTSIAFPLFSEVRLRWVLSIEAEEVECSPLSLARLVRLVAPLELALDAVTTTERVGAALAEVADLGRFTALPVSPRQEAVVVRLRRLTKMLGAEAAAFVDLDGPEAETTHVRDGAPTAVHRLAVGEEVETLERRLQTELQRRLLATTPDRGPTVSFSLNVDNAQMPVRREPVDPELGASLAWLIQQTLSPPALPRGSYVLAPLWTPLEAERQVRGFLLVEMAEAWPPFPRSVLRLDELTRAFASSLVSIEKTAARNALQGWAAAGVGPIHQLLKVVEDCRLGFRANDTAAQRDAIDVLGEQLWLLHQFSRPVTRPEGRDAAPLVTIAAAIASGVRHGVVLAGEIDDPQVDVAAAAGRRRITATAHTAFNAVLSCLLSNAYTYGSGDVRVVAVPAPAGVSVTIENRARLDPDGLERLREAGIAAQKVAHGAASRVFDRLAELAPRNGLRGVGTWLAARVARELLGGELVLGCDPVPGVSDRYLVRATLRIPAVDVDGEERQGEAQG